MMEKILISAIVLLFIGMAFIPTTTSTNIKTVEKAKVLAEPDYKFPMAHIKLDGQVQNYGGLFILFWFPILPWLKYGENRFYAVYTCRISKLIEGTITVTPNNGDPVVIGPGGYVDAKFFIGWWDIFDMDGTYDYLDGKLIDAEVYLSGE